MWCTMYISILYDAQESAKLILESEKFEASYKKVRLHLLSAGGPIHFTWTLRWTITYRTIKIQDTMYQYQQTTWNQPNPLRFNPNLFGNIPNLQFPHIYRFFLPVFVKMFMQFPSFSTCFWTPSVPTHLLDLARTWTAARRCITWPVGATSRWRSPCWRRGSPVEKRGDDTENWQNTI